MVIAKKPLIISAAVILIAAAIVVGYYLYKKSQVHRTPTDAQMQDILKTATDMSTNNFTLEQKRAILKKTYNAPLTDAQKKAQDAAKKAFMARFGITTDPTLSTTTKK